MTDTLQLTDLDPITLILPINGNVRTDTRLDKQFLASVKNRGVLTPILVTPNADGGYDVLDGQRRTLAAIDAGQPTIPVVITTQREDPDRIADQLTVNDHRTALTDTEHATAFQQLALFGLSAAQISKKTSTPLARVGDAITVAKNDTAMQALAEYDIDLTQAVVIAEFSDDKAAVKKLTDVAKNNPGGFEHVARGVRDARALTEHKDSLHLEIDADGYTKLKNLSNWENPPTDLQLTSLHSWALADSPTTPLTVEYLRGVDGVHAAVKDTYDTVDGSYRHWAEIAYFITADAAQRAGFVNRSYAASTPTRELTPEEAAEQEARAKRLAERDAARVAREQAGTVRRAFIVELLQRPTIPSDAINYVAWAMTIAAIDNVSDQVADWLNLTVDPNYVNDHRTANEKAVTEALNTRPKLAGTFVLAQTLDAMEALTHWYDGSSDAYGDYRSAALIHLSQLRAWGYGLSDAETELLAAASTTDDTPLTVDADADADAQEDGND